MTVGFTGSFLQILLADFVSREEMPAALFTKKMMAFCEISKKSVLWLVQRSDDYEMSFPFFHVTEIVFADFVRLSLKTGRFFSRNCKVSTKLSCWWASVGCESTNFAVYWKRFLKYKQFLKRTVCLIVLGGHTQQLFEFKIVHIQQLHKFILDEKWNLKSKIRLFQIRMWYFKQTTAYHHTRFKEKDFKHEIIRNENIYLSCWINIWAVYSRVGIYTVFEEIFSGFADHSHWFVWGCLTEMSGCSRTALSQSCKWTGNWRKS